MTVRVVVFGSPGVVLVTVTGSGVGVTGVVELLVVVVSTIGEGMVVVEMGVVIGGGMVAAGERVSNGCR